MLPLNKAIPFSKKWPVHGTGPKVYLQWFTKGIGSFILLFMVNSLLFPLCFSRFKSFCCLIDYKLNKKKSTEKKDKKEDGKEVEVFIDNAFDPRAELSKQGSHHEEAKGTAES